MLITKKQIALRLLFYLLLVAPIISLIIAEYFVNTSWLSSFLNFFNEYQAIADFPGAFEKACFTTK